MKDLLYRDDGAVLQMMSREAEAMEARIRYNFAMLTSEALFTDRVIPWWSPAYKAALFGGDAPRGERYPGFAVTWPATDNQVARVVLEAGPERLRFRFYNFEDREAALPVRLWRTNAGRWSLCISRGSGETLASSEIAVTARTQIVKLALPARTEVAVSLSYHGEVRTARK